MLIVSQKPDATHVAGFKTWKSLSRFVKKGEKGIVIIAPMLIKPKEVTDLSPAEEFSTLVHELAHEMLHRRDGEQRPSKTVRETEAEAVAFVVSQAIGLEAGTAAADYIRLYDGDTDTLAASLDRIQKTAAAIIEAITHDDE